MELTRRNFVSGAATGLGAAALFGMLGCAAEKPAETPEATDAPAEETITAEKTIDCDFCVVGAGFSGLIAALQAAEDGYKVVALEASPQAGGAALTGIEGSFAIDSQEAQRQGVTVDKQAVLESEMEQSQYRADGLSWLEMMDNSGANMDWLMEHGVRVAQVDNYHGGEFASFHWYADGAPNGYAAPMIAACEAAGVQFEYEVAGKKLIQGADGVVTGVYAQDAAGAWIQVNAPVVIIATGGFGQNHKLCAEMGYPEDRIMSVGSIFSDGSGHDMAVAAGAKDFIANACDNCGAIIASVPFCPPHIGWCMAPEVPWINEDCKRFYREDNAIVQNSRANPPKLTQRRGFMVWDSSILAARQKGLEEGIHPYGETLTKPFPELIEDGINAGQGDIWKADTLDELAGLAGVDPEAFKAFVEEYNGMCAAGADTLFGKDPAYMMPIAEPPYYMAEPIWAMFATIGSVWTNRHMQAINAKHEPIPGLYVIGVDGCMLYRNVYTIGTPGSCSGNSINSARTAVAHAEATILA